EICTPQARQLRVQIGEQPSLQQRVVGKLDARHDIGGVESDLLGFGKEVVGVSVQNHLADDLQGHDLFRHQLCGIENIELEFCSRRLVHHLHAELEFRKVARSEKNTSE